MTPADSSGLREFFCWAANLCFRDGAFTSGDSAYVAVEVNGELRRWDGQPISLATVGPGGVNYVRVKIMDTYYDDNSGTLKGVLY